MSFKVNKVDNINTTFNGKTEKVGNKGNELLFNTNNTPDGTVYTNDSAKNLFNKLLTNPDGMSLLDAASVMFPDEQITEVSEETLKELPLYQEKENIEETLELKDESGNSFYFVKYVNGTTQMLLPDDTYIVKEPNSMGANEYMYADGILQKITLERINNNGEKIVSEYEINDEGYFVGYAKEGETIQDVLRNLGIEEGSPEAKQFIELNKKNIKSFKGNKKTVKAFVVGREMLIHPDNAINGMEYLYTSPEKEQDKYADRTLNNVKIDSYPTVRRTLTANISWWELSKQNLINNHGIAKPTDDQIAENMLILQKLNGKNKELVKGAEVTLTMVENPDIPEEFRYETYSMNNLRKMYPADKYTIEGSPESGLVSIQDKNKNQICYISYKFFYTQDTNELCYSELEIYKYDYDNLGRRTEFSTISIDEPNGSHSKSIRKYEYKNSTNGIERYIYDEGNLSSIEFYQNSVYEKPLIINIEPQTGKRFSRTSDGLTYYNDNNEIIFLYDYETLKISSPVADKLYNALTTQNEKEFYTITSQFDEKYYFDIYDAYYNTYNQDLISDIESSPFSQKIKNEFLKNMKTAISNDLFFKVPENTDEFNFTYVNDVLTIKNLKNNTTHTIDFNTRFEGFRYADERRLINTILSMPPQALEDLSIENRKIVLLGENIKRLSAGEYNTTNECIYIRQNHINNVNILIHELGHAIDYWGLLANTPLSQEFEEFKNLFEKNLERYEKDGHIRHKWNDDRTESNGKLYATDNEKEMFAECYTWIMTGRLGRPEEEEQLFVKYFSENIEMVRNMLEQIRNLPDIKRYNPNHGNNFLSDYL